MTGNNTEEECHQLQREISTILELAKWCSNSLAIITSITKNPNDPLFNLDLEDEDIIKSLRLCWQPGHWFQ